MRFWTPKINAEEKSWSVILNPLKGELDKKRVAEKISELFRVTAEEARDLVQNTPIILLDQLPHAEALQVQNIFQQVRADVTLTSDSLFKRRCYRAIWPEPPRLAFLNSAVSREESEKKVEEIPMKTVVEAISSPHAAERIETPPQPFQDLEKKFRELEALYEAETRENQELRQGLERALKDHSEKNAAHLRSTVEEWEERTQGLREEYQEAKMIYEEKILAYERELDGFRAQLKELQAWQEKAADLEGQNKTLAGKLNELESSRETLNRTLKERLDEMGLWREKYQNLAQKLERTEALYEEEKNRREHAEEATHRAAETAEHTRREIEIQSEEAERWQRMFEELKESQRNLEQEFSQFSEQQEVEIRRLRETNRDLVLQLESAQRQTRELLFRVEEQQALEKRTRLANELAEKEARLREVTLETERLRQEIHERELRAQELTGERSDLERDILESKQAQRYLAEQSKLKEKPSKLKRPGRNLDSSERGLGAGDG